jgi:hypothetical protein
MMPRSTPEYFSLLSESDQVGYYTLQGQVLSLTENHRRGLRAAIFTEALELIHAWAQRGDADDWKRCLVCGLYRLGTGVAVNARQLQFLTRRCKSAINGALKLMGYATVSARGDVNPDLVCALPVLKGNTHALRQWSVRRVEPRAAGEDRAEGRADDPAAGAGTEQGGELLCQQMPGCADGPDPFGLGQDDLWLWDRFWL